MRNASRADAALATSPGLLVLAAAACSRSRRLAPNPYILSAGIIVLNYAVLATSWNFVGGFTGYISLGHGALAGLGGYATGLLVTKAGVPSFVALFVAAVLVVAALAVPIGFAALRVRGASFVIVSIALVLILLLVFQSWASFTGGSRGLVVPRPFPGLLRPEHHRVFFFLFAALLARRAARLVADRPVPVRHGAQGDPGGRGQGRGAGHADVRVQADRLRRLGGLHRAGRRPVRAVVRRPRPGVPVLDPDRRRTWC